MYTYSHYIFSSGATLSCCVLVCKNTGTCTVFNAKSSLMYVRVQFFFEITEPTEDKVHAGPPRDRGEDLFKRFRSVVLYFNFVSPRGRGLLAGILPQILPRQCRAFSRALKNEKLKAPLFRGPEGAGATNDWCITVTTTPVRSTISLRS